MTDNLKIFSSDKLGTHFYEKEYAVPVNAHKVLLIYYQGDDIVTFNFGSTVVLIFESEKGYAFDVKPGDKVKMGENIGHIDF